MSKRVTQLHLAGVATALALLTAPAFAQQGGANNAAMMARRDSCYTAVTGDTAKLSAKIQRATASGSSMQDANRSVMASMDSTQRRAVMTCARGTAAAPRTPATSTGDVSLNNRARSQQRIPVTKEVGTGPVRDTTVAVVPEPTPAPTPAPEPPPMPAPAPVETTTYTPAPAPMVVKHYGNWYIGFGGGTAVPMEELRPAYDPGANFNIPIGWQSPESVLGFRVNLGYSKFEARTAFRSNSTTTTGAQLALQDPQIWSGMADLTLRLPFLGSWGGPMNGVYLVGGGGFNKFSDYFENLARTNPELNAGNDFSTKEAVTRFAANAGGGFSIGLGMADVFAEARYVRAFTPNHGTSYVPINIGLAFHR